MLTTGTPELFAQVAVAGEELRDFNAQFPEQNVGFYHVYALPAPDPVTDYQLVGQEMGPAHIALLPTKYQRIAQRMNARVYAAAAVRSPDGNYFLVRMDGPDEDRVEMFAFRNGRVEHLKSLAYRGCSSSTRCNQLDSWLTDIDGNSNLDLIQIASKPNGKMKRAVYVMQSAGGDWRKTNNMADVPWTSTNPWQEGDELMMNGDGN